ncbi:MAG: RNA-guided pseudouridylation complex pseudouridine synthase subunit Cbf5 [Methanoregulaceae archaeon]|nr:RNA-guided pseudouridylation complex pseudouridine synthase subunit Cbf5 [Methanoregulaceae archaeon]
MTVSLPGNGLYVIDKPRGPSSHQVTAWIGRILGLPVGHAGTLDPGVSGVLVVMSGQAVRLAPVLLAEEKEYVCAMRAHGNVSREQMEEAISQFTGRIYQRPPRKSAVARSLRIRTVHSIELLDISGRIFLLRIHCDAGTYIRSLCYHLGLVLGTGAHMEELRRTRSGNFREEQAITVQQLADAVVCARRGGPSPLLEMAHPLIEGLSSLPRVIVRDSAVDALCHGADLAVPGIREYDEFSKGTNVALLTSRDELIGIGTSLHSSKESLALEHGLIISPHSVFMEPGTYPRGWKKRRERVPGSQAAQR